MYPFQCAFKTKIVFLLSRELSLIKRQYQVNNIPALPRYGRHLQRGEFGEMQHKQVEVGLMALGAF